MQTCLGLALSSGDPLGYFNFSSLKNSKSNSPCYDDHPSAITIKKKCIKWVSVKLVWKYEELETHIIQTLKVVSFEDSDY